MLVYIHLPLYSNYKVETCQSLYGEDIYGQSIVIVVYKEFRTQVTNKYNNESNILNPM